MNKRYLFLPLRSASETLQKDISRPTAEEVYDACRVWVPVHDGAAENCEAEEEGCGGDGEERERDGALKSH